MPPTRHTHRTSTNSPPSVDGCLEDCYTVWTGGALRIVSAFWLSGKSRLKGAAMRRLTAFVFASMVSAACLGVSNAQGYRAVEVNAAEACAIFGGCGQLGIVTTPKCTVAANCASWSDFFSSCNNGTCVTCPTVNDPVIAAGVAKMGTLNTACPAGTMNGVCPAVKPCTCPGPLIDVACGFFPRNVVVSANCGGS
jgi:hypothetical protein